MVLQVVSMDPDQVAELLAVGNRIANALEALVELAAAGPEDTGYRCPHCGETDPEKAEDTSSSDGARTTCITCGKSTTLEGR